MSSENDGARLMTESLIVNFVKENGWYIPQLHEKYLRIELGDKSSYGD
jgi:hypothetical protein